MGETPRIIIVDDDESIRKVLATIMKEKGYAVDTVENAKQAIRRCQRRFYNMALIDIRLPDMEGTRLLGKIKETSPRMRKIIITGYPSMQTAIEAVNRGADAYILKPFDMDKVLKTIHEQLAKQRAEKKLGQEKVKEFIETRVKELALEKPPSNEG